MNTDEEILEVIDKAFNSINKPVNFIDETLSEEHADHNDTLKSRTRETLTIEDVGNPAWNPLSYISGEGMAYFFPKLARLALRPPEYYYDWYAEQLIIHLTGGEVFERFFEYCNPEQKNAVAELINHITISRAELLKKYGGEDDFTKGYNSWQD